jgi:hypothetical protein
MCKSWLVILLLILIIVAACLLSYSLFNSLFNSQKKGDGECNDLQKCSRDIVRLVGGDEKIVSLRVLNKIMPYLKEVGNSKPVEEYLLKHFEYRTTKREELRDDASRDELAPKKYKMLHTIISDIINNNNIYSAEEFFKKSRLTYQEFLPDKYRRIFDEYVKRAQPAKEDVKKISKIFDKYLSEEGTHLIKSKLLDKTEDLIRTNVEYKFKPGRLDLTPDRLKAMAVSDPKKIFEIDYVAMLPAMHEQAEASANKKAHEYGRRSDNDDLRRQLERDIETLRLLRDYPSTLTRQREREEIVRRLELAAARLYSPSYARKLLKDLYDDYPYLTPALLVPKDNWYDYSKRRKAEQETYDERTKRIEAERERDAARAAQTESDRAYAERIQREEQERERAGEEYMQQARDREAALQARDREAALQAQLARAYEANKQSETAQLMKQRAEEAQEAAEFAAVGINPENPPEGFDPELWATMGAKEKHKFLKNSESDLLKKDNMDIPIIPLN